ncbi:MULTISPECIES: class I SAM-dependent DNA methyltransferase [Micromonospora]|uniref:class I SAM-dependent DNA methyltransferase n=1 Tax=Micromonospora TaxID=1873 RepID=UPI001B367169|nr:MULTISPECIES: class I SAM-dependent DNA methyltransferase [Micromonospora]MBQ1059835.1 class I SAM-dependent DNA methyltransferase [Micromonospora sp. C41]WDQ01255.1 class I SAM-dependent DNA methyltransferase [Micromonospora chalcea]
MSFEALTNRGEYLSAHYLAEILPTTLKGGLLKQWAEREKAGDQTPRTGLRGLRRPYFDAKTELADDDFFDPERLRKLHQELLKALGFEPQPQTITVERAGQEHQITVAHAELTSAHGIVALDCGWAVDAEAAQDPDDAGRLLAPVTLSGTETIDTGAKLASWLFAADDPKPRYVLILSGGVVTLADRTAWGEGRYLAVSLDTAYARNDDREYDVVAALFGADSLRPPAEGGTEPLADLVAGSRQHAVGVSGELREGLKVSVELIANEVLDRIRQAGYQPQDVMELDELARALGREALRYLYRILFLLYAEARPELGVLPVNDREYVEGYSLARIGDLVSRKLAPSAEGGFHLYESLDLLFRMVNDGHRPRAGAEVDDKASEGEGLRFEPMKSDLFLREKTKLIGRLLAPDSDDEDDPDAATIDTRLRNKVLYQVLRRLMLTKGAKRRRGGFISYAQLGINQLGAVYEGLMSYTGFVATEQLYEVAKNGDPKDGSWMIPASKADEYDDNVFVYKEDPYTGVRSRVSYAPGAFVYRLAGRDRQTSASYYTPQSLTEVTVQLALKYRLDQDGTVTPARELLDWTICEPALGSGAFLNEAINQVAAEYLRRRARELKVDLDPEQYHLELQRVKAYIALHNSYGVDLNRTAVELAEVSLWLNVMHAGLQAPWFGLHLQRGNSLIGCGRKAYEPKQLADKSWLTTAPAEKPFRDGPIDEGAIHHFLLPADGWGAVAGEKEARELAPAETAKLKAWRTAMKRVPSAKGKNSQVKRLQALARRVEFLWGLVQQRLAISEREIRRDIEIWGADDLPPVTEAVARDKILADLTAPGTPYWRLKTLMDAWCALWFWPLDKVGLLDGSDPAAYPAESVQVSHVKDVPEYEEQVVYETPDIFGNVEPRQMTLPTKATGTRRMTVAEQLRKQVPLTNLDDWLTFAEALVGRSDVDENTERFYGRKLDSLTEMSELEQKLDGVIGVDSPWMLADRFPWLLAAERIAEQQGFFHWELTFAQAFAKGGFDLQVGNPPWVRPIWQEDVVLGDRDPWFSLVGRQNTEEWQLRKTELLRSGRERRDHLREFSATVGRAGTLGAAAIYPLLTGTQPDLYRAFMCQTWRNITQSGVSGLIHPDTHFSGAREGRLRAAAYAHLRLHGHFSNRRGVFPEVHANTEFGIHIYGRSSPVNFTHVSWLFDPGTLSASLVHDGEGEAPGIKHNGRWELRPHRRRLVQVTKCLLDQWQQLSSAEVPSLEASLLYPVTLDEQGAISALAKVKHRLGERRLQVSSGYHEANSKADGLIRWRTGEPDTIEEVILQGPHLGIANPFNKEPNYPCRTNRDWSSRSLLLLPESAIHRTNYVRSCERDRYLRSQSQWNGRPFSARYRLAWRKMIAFDTERSLFAALIPPGPAHVHAVYSLALETDRETALAAGFFSALPLDYLLRITGRSDLQVAEAQRMPAADVSHPLAAPLLLRVLRLNCLTRAYAALWSGLFVDSWQKEAWAVGWQGFAPLGDVDASWHWSSPLRAERERRAALVEIDALVAAWLGISADQLVAVYRARYPILRDYEEATWFDALGRKIARSHNSYGFGQTKEHHEQLIAYLENPERNPVPEGYTAPFYKADRENEYRQAHAVFSKRLQDAIDAGWQSS